MSTFNLFMDAIKGGNLEEVKKKFKAEFINKRKEGWSALHWAAYYNDKDDVVKYLVSEGCNIEDEIIKSDDRCIHILVKWEKIDILRTLIYEGCELECRNKNNETPLSMAISKGKKECEEMIKKAQKDKAVIDDLCLLRKKGLSEIFDHRTGKTYLDKLLLNKDPRILEEIKLTKVTEEEIDQWQKLDLRTIDLDSYSLLQECFLARCLNQRYEDGIYDLCTVELVNKASLFMDATALETAVKCGVSVNSVKNILWRYVKEDESWQNAENIAREKKQIKVIDLISKRRRSLNKKNSFSRLHVAVMDNDPELIEYMMKNQIINVDEGLKKCGSALSLAYNLDLMDCVECLQNNDINVNTLDKFGQTPLHIAIYHRREEYSEYLVNNICITKLECKDFMKFTLLERAVMNDCENFSDKLVKRGVKCDNYVKIDPKLLDMDPNLAMILYNIPHLPVTISETIYTLCYKVNKFVYPCLFDTLNQQNVNLTDEDGNTLLHLFAMSLKSALCSRLLLLSDQLDLENKFKRTSLFELLVKNEEGDLNAEQKDILENVNVLIEGGASLNVEDINGCDILEISTKYENEELLLTLISKGKPIDKIKKKEWYTWINKAYYKFIKEAIPLINVTLLQDWITEDNIKNCLEVNDLLLAKMMYDKAKTDLQKKVVNAILCRIASAKDKELFKVMIQSNLLFKDSYKEEESLLNILIKDNNTEFIELIILSKHKYELLEKEDMQKKLPLHVSIENESWNIVDQLIFNTKSIDHEDTDGNTPLSILLTKMCEREDQNIINKLMVYVTSLILRKADINKVNSLGKTVISYCTNFDLLQKIELFIEDNSKINE